MKTLDMKNESSLTTTIMIETVMDVIQTASLKENGFESSDGSYTHSVVEYLAYQVFIASNKNQNLTIE